MAGQELQVVKLLKCMQEEKKARLTASIFWLTVSMERTIKLYEDMEYGASVNS